MCERTKVNCILEVDRTLFSVVKVPWYMDKFEVARHGNKIKNIHCDTHLATFSMAVFSWSLAVAACFLNVALYLRGGPLFLCCCAFFPFIRSKHLFLFHHCCPLFLGWCLLFLSCCPFFLQVAPWNVLFVSCLLYTMPLFFALCFLPLVP